MPPPLGFLMLETDFPRIAGDAGCADTWHFPVQYYTVPKATAAQVVRRRGENLLPAFVAGGRQLAQQGVIGISTTCGFMCLHQQALAAALPVPLLSSALMLAPQLLRRLPPHKKLGILTVSAADLTEDYLHAAGISAADVGRIAVSGLHPNSHFAGVLLNDETALNETQAEADLLAAADSLLSADNDIAAWLLECTNMPPYRRALQEKTALPVYSILDAVNDFYQRLTASNTPH